MEAEKISLRPRPIAPIPVMFLISPESSVSATETAQETSHTHLSLPTIDEIVENALVPDENNGDETRIKDKTYLMHETEQTEVKDNEDDIAALVMASSNIRSSPKGRTSNAARKKSKHIRDVETSLSLLLPDNREVAEEKAFGFAQSYFMKVKEKLEESDNEHYQQFLEALYDFGSKITTVPELYKRISVILHRYPDLVSEFIVFLLPEQAMQCGKLMEHLMLTKMNTFFRRLEVYFKRQPQQLRKIYTALTVLSTQANVTMNDVRNAILPLLKGNNFLIESFLEIMPQEHLPDSIMTDFDELGCIEFDSDNSGEDDHVETLIVPDEEDKYGSDTCICTCHNSTKQKYRSRIHHCVPCGTKFIHGKVFMQIGKILRPAKVLFPDGDMAACFERLLPIQCVKKSRKKGSMKCELGAVKDTSPSKVAQNATAIQNRSSLQSDTNNLAGKDPIKSKTVKHKCINKNNKIREQTGAENGPVTHITRSSRNSSLKVCIKVPKLSGADKISNEIVSKKVSLKRPRSTSKSRVCQRPFEPGNKSPAIPDKEITCDTVCSSGSQDKSDDHQDSLASEQPAKKQCRASDNIYAPELSITEDNFSETTKSPIAVSIVSNEPQIPRQLSVVLKRVTSSQTGACTTGTNLQVEDQLTLQREDVSVCDNLHLISLQKTNVTVTTCSMDMEVDQSESKETAVDGRGTELLFAADSEKRHLTIQDHLQHQECCSNEEGMDFQHKNDTDGNKSDMASQLCSSGSKLEDAMEMSWTKDEDKVILKMFQQECAMERILYMIQQQLPQRSVEQIQNRFQTLMNLLQKMTGVHMDDDQGT